MRLFRIVFTFYQSFIAASSIITLACLSTIFISGLKTLPAVLMFKLFTSGIIMLYINLYKKKEFYYYQNLGLTRTHLWMVTLGADLILFVLSIILIIWAT